MLAPFALAPFYLLAVWAPTTYESCWMDQVTLHSYWQTQLSLPRNREVKRLLKSGFKAYSQNDEDGIIQEIFLRIGEAARVVVEFGVGNGGQCNSLWLLLQGWKGLWIEASEKCFGQIRRSHEAMIGDGRLTVVREFINAENIDQLIARNLPSADVDLLSIDIDFNDYWVWRAINSIRPRVVVIEYNATWRPPLSVTVPYTAQAVWKGSNYFGASLAALAKLGRAKGYLLVGCCFAGVNAFFVREDLCGDHFLAPGDALEHYEPARYFMSMLAAGHPPGIGPLVEI